MKIPLRVGGVDSGRYVFVGSVYRHLEGPPRLPEHPAGDLLGRHDHAVVLVAAPGLGHVLHQLAVEVHGFTSFRASPSLLRHL